jgi:hypothetical protein
VLPRLAAALLAGVLGFAGRLTAQASASPDSLTEVLLQLRIEGGPSEVVSALARDTVTLLPVGRFLELAEIRLVPSAGHRVAGVLEPGRLPLVFDADSGIVSRGDSVWRLGPGALVWADDVLYAAAGAVAIATRTELQTDFGELILLVSQTSELPVVRRLAREQRRRVLLGLPPATPWTTSLPRPRRVAGGAVLDWAYTGAMEDPLGASLLQLGLGTQVLGGSLEMQYAGQQSDAGNTTDIRSSWSGAWPTARWVRQVRLGDIVPGARRGRVLRGFELTNAPYLRPAAFGQELLDGNLPAGWEVDLYQDRQLLGYTAVDTAGRYALDLPLQYGSNPVELLAYGPHGEVVRWRRTVQVPFDRLQAGRFEYAVSGGACHGEPCSAALSLSARYGVRSWLTAEAGSDNFWRDSLPDLWHPYALVSAAVTPSVGVTFEGVRRGLVRGRVDLDPTPDLHLDLEHIRFATGVVSPLIGGGEHDRTDGVIFWRPGPSESSSFLQFAFSHATLTSGSLDAERLALTSRLGDLRVVTGLHHRQLPDAAAGGSQVGIDAAGDLVLRGPGPILRSLFLRADASFETSGLSHAAVGAGRQLTGPVRLDLGAGWTRGQPGLSLDLTVSTNLPGLRGLSRGRYDDAAGFQGTNFLEGSATYDGHLRRLELDNGRLVGRARIVGRVFHDLDGDGAQGPGEPGVAGVRLRVGSRGVVTDSLGRYSAADLVPYETMSVEVDTLSLEDPLWVPASLVYRLVPGPNSENAVDVALLPGSEVSGRVALGDKGVGGVPVILRHLASKVVIRVTTFGDGSFYASGLRPGEYEASVAPEALDLLHAVEVRATVTVDPGAGPGSVDGVALELTPASNPTTAPTAAPTVAQ